MRKIIICSIIFALCLALAACSTSEFLSDSENDISSSVPLQSHPQSNTSTSETESNSGNSQSSNTISSPASSSPTAESKPPETNNGTSVTEAVPEISGKGFYKNTDGSVVSIMIPLEGRFALSFEKAKDLFSGIDFSKCAPTDEIYDIDMLSADPGIVFTSSAFEYELRLDKNTNIAIYVINGDATYYYKMSSGFYDTTYKRVKEYEQFDYNMNEEVPVYDENNNLNVTTG